MSRSPNPARYATAASPDWPVGVICALQRVRVQLIYFCRHSRLANLTAPRRLTEHIQRRKLDPSDPRLPLLADKVAVKAHVARLLGSAWTVPLLWHGDQLPGRPAWPYPFVAKSRHGCGHFRVVRNAGDYTAARRASSRWMRRTYGRWLDEHHYAAIAPGLLVEPFVGEGFDYPTDYKLFVFNGRVRFVQVHLGRRTRHRWIVFDLDWRRVSPPSEDPDPKRPATLDRMITAAERLGRDFDFVRADFYEVAGRPLFGELTFFPGSGLEPVEPPALDAEMGAWWSRSRAAAPASQPPFSSLLPLFLPIS